MGVQIHNNPKQKMIIAIVLLCAIVQLVTSENYSLVVETSYGKVEGYFYENARIFRGIPYAAAPLGELRWEDTKAHDSWEDTFKAFEDAPGCPQICTSSKFTCPNITSEDCLYLNVWTPSIQPSNHTLLPVMVFIHGGNFIMVFIFLLCIFFGLNLFCLFLPYFYVFFLIFILFFFDKNKKEYGGGDLYDGTKLVQIADVIVVTIQYRLGSLGFLYSEEFDIFGKVFFYCVFFAILRILLIL